MYSNLSLEKDNNLKSIIKEKYETENDAFLSSEHLDIFDSASKSDVTEEERNLSVKVKKVEKTQTYRFEDIKLIIKDSLNAFLQATNPENYSYEEKYKQSQISFVNESTLTFFDIAKTYGKKLEDLSLTEKDFYLIIEQALVRNEGYGTAKAVAYLRALADKEKNKQTENFLNPAVRLVRRNGNVVPWSETKIEIAVSRAFLHIKENPSPAVSIAKAVTQKVREGYQSFIHIEEVQDMVQEELMAQQHFKVASHYIRYRDERARQRVALGDRKEEVNEQATIQVIKSDGSSIEWDGSELRKRISFALIGLNLNLDEKEIERELRRSLSSEIKEEDLQKTIILNSKSLIEKDADFTKFAARILLSYIYEEVLDWSIQRDGVEHLREAHKNYFSKYITRAIELNRLNADLKSTFDLKKLANAIDPSADLDFDFIGIQTLYDRYLIVDKTSTKHRRLETPQIFWMRVAMGIFIPVEDGKNNNSNDKATKLHRVYKTIELYRVYKDRRFCSSTPTLFNSATPRSQLSSCYLYKVDDSLESIMTRGIAENAFLSKWAGGLGGSWTAVRGTGSHIEGTNGESQGVIPFLKLHNDQLLAVNQGGKRKGSGCAYLESWHSDIEDFLELRRNVGEDRRRCHDMNTANWIPDLFMKRMEAREQWTLFRSNETPDLHDLYGKAFERRYVEYEALAAEGKIWSRQMPALDLWKSMLRMIFETGHPWITFKDACNVRSPQDHAGVVHSSNLCTEITLNTSADETAVCNLGSIVLDTHINSKGDIDHELLEKTVKIAVRALDNVIDINFYPTEAAKNSNVKNRPIGLGVMGLQKALYKKGINFASQEAIEFNDEFMEAIAFYAYKASSELAAEKGTYSSYEGSKWSRSILPQDTIELLEEERGKKIDTPKNSKLNWDAMRESIKKYGIRNSNVIAIAPTASIANIMGTTPCIEPNYKNLYVKSNLSGDFTILNSVLVNDLKNENLWNQDMLDQLKYFDGELDSIENIPDYLKEKHKTVFGVGYEAIIDAASRRQKWIDQSQSVNLFLAEPDMKTLSHMYRRAWEKGLKTTYYLRTLQASNIEKATIDVKKQVRGNMANSSDHLSKTQQSCSLEAMMNGEECESCQ